MGCKYSAIFNTVNNTDNKCITKYLNKKSIPRVIDIAVGIGYFRGKFMTIWSSDKKEKRL